MENMQRELRLLQDRLSLAMRHNLTVARQEMVSMEEILKALSPQGLLSRGYSFVEHPDSGIPIRSVNDVQPGAPIRAHVADGCFTADVTDVIKNNDSIVETGDRE